MSSRRSSGVNVDASIVYTLQEDNINNIIIIIYLIYLSFVENHPLYKLCYIGILPDYKYKGAPGTLQYPHRNIRHTDHYI